MTFGQKILIEKKIFKVISLFSGRFKLGKEWSFGIPFHVYLFRSDYISYVDSLLEGRNPFYHNLLS